MTWNSVKRKLERANRSWSRPIRRRVGRSTKVLSKIASRAGRIARGMPKWGPLAAIAQMGMDTPWNRSYKKFKERQWANKRAVKGGGPVPKTPSSTVSARYAVAPKLTKFKKPTKKASLKQPKSAMVHYKEYGLFKARQVMYINHEHIGSVDKMWFGIGVGLTKMLLGKAKVYPAKSMDDPMIGPRTNILNESVQYDDKASGGIIRLQFTYTDNDGNNAQIFKDVTYENLTPVPDTYRSLSSIAFDVAGALQTAYYTTAVSGQSHNSGAYLSAAQIYQYTSNPANTVLPIFVQNLDDAEIHLYVKSLIKFQNVTVADHGYNESIVHGGQTDPALGSLLNAQSAFDKNAIDANPLIGRVYSAKGLSPDVDSELASAPLNGVGGTAGTLDKFFQKRQHEGLTLCGFDATVDSVDLARVAHIPTPKEIYGPQTVTSGHISMPPGSMKYHKTSFTLIKTFKELSKYFVPYDKGETGATVDINHRQHQRRTFKHTLFGLKCAHKHGADMISVGYNREVDIGCYVKPIIKKFPLKAAYNDDRHITEVFYLPNESYGQAAPPDV